MNLFLAVDSFARASCSGLQSREGERRRRGRSLEKRKKERNEKRKEEGKKWTVKQHGSQRLSGASGPAINTNTTTTGVISFSFSSRSRRGIGGGEPLTKRCVFLEAGWSAAVHIGSRLSSARWIKSRSWTTFGIASAQRREQRLYSEHESSWMWPLGPGSSRCTRSTYLLYAYWAWMEDEAFLGNEIISLIKRTPSSRAYGPLEHRAIPQPADSKNRWREKREGEKKKEKRRRDVLQTKKISGEKSSSSLISSGNECKDCWPFCGEHGETGLTHIASPRFPYLSESNTPALRHGDFPRDIDSIALLTVPFSLRFLDQERFLNAICENWTVLYICNRMKFRWEISLRDRSIVEFFYFSFLFLNFVPDNQREDT